MPLPRRRQPSTLSEWPQLSLLAIYADEPVFDAGEGAAALSDEALEAARILYFATPLEEQPYDAARRNRATGTVLGVSSFARASSGTDASEGSREDPPASLAEDEILLASLQWAYAEYRLRFGTIQGVLDAEGKEGVMGKLHEFWNVWTRNWETSILGSQVEQLLQAVPKSAILTTEAAAQLGPLLAQFAASNPSALPILMHGDTVLSLPHLSLISVDQPPTAPGRPSPPPLSQDDLLALVHYMDRLLPPRRTLSVVSNVNDATSAPSAGEDSAGSGRWSSLTAGMSSFLAPRPFSLAMPGLPGTTALSGSRKAPNQPATLRAGFAALRRTEQQEVAKRQQEVSASADGTRPAEDGNPAAAPSAKGSSWSLRNVNWGALGFGSSENGSVDCPPTPTEPDESVPHAGQEPQDDRDLATDAVSTNTTPVATDFSPSNEEASQPTTPAVELVPSVDVTELADAIGQTPTKERDQPVIDVKPAPEGLELRAAENEDTAEELPPRHEERVKAVRLFCGEGDSQDTLFEARLYKRGGLRLALAILLSTDAAALAWLDGRAERLLEAVESLLEVVVPPKPLYPHRHLVKHDLLVNSVSPAGPAATTTADTEADCALIDSYVALHSHPRVLESVSRLSSTRWSLHRRFSTTLALDAKIGLPAIDTTDVFAILPSRGANGKDLSLIDAADELRRIERAYLRKA
ncbi:proteophosphoglycan 5 [Rhodotorula toruloides]|uniref:Proteophosphoglycan 5 n=1 Tax=Rhodotorula toruloides TaxID=5286 RepID=A0A511KFE0_RHOTO|nr:proteophosphoglycan 5 [Rhodotorula toruloides]